MKRRQQALMDAVLKDPTVEDVADDILGAAAQRRHSTKAAYSQAVAYQYFRGNPGRDSAAL
jgi:hypothetical protein